MPNQRKGTPDQIEIGLKILNAREKLGLSQEELAERVEVSKNTIYRYESAQGGSMSVDTFLKFAEVLGKTPTELAPSRFQKADPVDTEIAYEVYQQLGEKKSLRFAQILKSLVDELNP